MAPVKVDAKLPPVVIAAAPVRPPAAPLALNADAVPVTLSFVAAPAPAPAVAIKAAVVLAIVSTKPPLPPAKPVAPLPVDAAAMPAIIAAAPIGPRVRSLSPMKSIVPVPVPARAETLPAAVALPQRPAPLQPAENKPKPQIVAQDATEPARQPYLERLSTGEVALVTTSQPLWRRRSPPSIAVASVQWLPLNRVIGRPAIQLLNAARSQGLAAHTREALADRGWRKLSIGDAREIRERSLVLYSPEHKALAWRLAAQLRCKAAKVEGQERVVVLLGRDAAQRRTAPLRT
jgi:hypothetical protein